MIESNKIIDSMVFDFLDLNLEFWNLLSMKTSWTIVIFQYDKKGQTYEKLLSWKQI